MDKPLTYIMCVDDEEDILDVAAMSLELVGGFKVSCCANGVKALEHLREERPDLILMDVMMPELDGPSTMARLRHMPGMADTPVVFMTAHVQPEKQQALVDLGALACISKPFDPMTLPERIETIWRAHDAQLPN